MRPLLTAALAAAALHAGTIRGVVVDNQTGRPVGRAVVVAQPIAGTAGAARSAVTAVDGAFELRDTGAGAWLVIATRRGFAPTEFGKGPIRLEAGGEANIAIRLRRFGAITGTVVDENDVGLQEQEVVAYRNAQPPVMVARSKTDDRGVYRIGGLPPGSYFVRTAARDSDEGSFVPTWSREAARLQESRAVDVQYDHEVVGVDVHPFPGSLVSFSGRVNAGRGATVTLTSDTGVLTTATDPNGRFRFPPLAPGPYELFAWQRDAAAWERLDLYRGTADHRVALAPQAVVSIRAEDTGGRSLVAGAVPILIRRRTLAGAGAPEPFGGSPRNLPPGRYEFSLAPSTSWYAVSLAGKPPRADGWLEVPVPTGDLEVKVVLSSRPATLRGVVRNAAGDPAAGAPVYLGVLRTVRTDTQGEFEFYGLAPGSYSLLASFDADTPTESNSRAVRLAEGEDQIVDLVLHTAQ